MAYDGLREAILSGELTAGQPLPQEEIASQLGVSRLPVREALRQLEAEGMVVLRPRRGYVVASLDVDEIRDIFEVQAMIEERAAFEATVKRTPADVAELRRYLDELDRLSAVTPLDIAEFTKYNSFFHERLFAISQREYLCRVLRLLRTTADRYTRMSAALMKEIGHSQREHHAIIDAFEVGDAAEVARLCREHRESIGRRLLEGLKAKAKRAEPKAPRKTR